MMATVQVFDIVKLLGVNERCRQPLVPHERLKGCDAAAGVDQLGGIDVPELVRWYNRKGGNVPVRKCKGGAYGNGPSISGTTA